MKLHPLELLASFKYTQHLINVKTVFLDLRVGVFNVVLHFWRYNLGALLLVGLKIVKIIVNVLVFFFGLDVFKPWKKVLLGLGSIFDRWK